MKPMHIILDWEVRYNCGEYQPTNNRCSPKSLDCPGHFKSTRWLAVIDVSCKYHVLEFQ